MQQVTSPDPNATRYEHLIRLVRVARGLEAGGYYNAAKLFWATAFSEEIRASNQQGVPTSADELNREMEAATDALEAAGAKPELLAVLKIGRQAAHENRTILQTEIPQVYVCRACGEIILGRDPHRCPACSARELTLREFPAVYFLEPLHPEQALEALAVAPNELEDAIKGLSEEQLAQLEKPGEWAIRDALFHLLLAQGLLAGRVEKMLAQDNPPLAGVAAWAIADEEALSAREILERFRASRQATVERLERMSGEDWWRTGQHDEFGEVTILQQASYFAKHDQSHLPQIVAIRQAIGA